ncbi:MAG: hypothetical protein LWW86_08760 [Micrococcales bacterium]|nr:hypothetical protein [Micrococcales bacterium]
MSTSQPGLPERPASMRDRAIARDGEDKRGPWWPFATAAVITLIGIAVLASGHLSGRGDPTQKCIASYRSWQSDARQVLQLVVPAEHAMRIDGVSPCQGSDTRPTLTVKLADGFDCPAAATRINERINRRPADLFEDYAGTTASCPAPTQLLIAGPKKQ